MSTFFSDTVMQIFTHALEENSPSKHYHITIDRMREELEKITYLSERERVEWLKFLQENECDLPPELTAEITGSLYVNLVLSHGPTISREHEFSELEQSRLQKMGISRSAQREFYKELFARIIKKLIPID